MALTVFWSVIPSLKIKRKKIIERLKAKKKTNLINNKII